MEPAQTTPPVIEPPEAKPGPVRRLSNLLYHHSKLAVVIVFALLGSGLAAASLASTNPVTAIAVNGTKLGPAYLGIGAISGGGGDSRYLVDYPAAQQSQIFDYLFKPDYGANLQLLKLEIGSDTNTTNGSEPSIEPVQGQINCNAGYEWTIAEQAEARNPNIKLYALQWAAPAWVGANVWTTKDVNYVIDWMNCAKSHKLTISYLGGWNEHSYNATWYENMRAALNSHGYGSVKIIADDEVAGDNWKIASALAGDKTFNAAVSDVGVHDTCGAPTNGYTCTSTTTAKNLSQPLWENEIGKLFVDTYGNSGAGAAWVRTINNTYNKASATGLFTWPLMEAAPPGPYSDRGIVTASTPWSGQYTVNQLAWATAHTTQFVPVGWHHINQANQPLGTSGTYNTYAAGDKSGWTVVAENTGQSASGKVIPEDVHVTVSDGLPAATVHVWETNLASTSPSAWLVQKPDVHPTKGAFTYTIPAGYVVTFTTSAGSHGSAASPATASTMPLPYTASADAADMPNMFAPQEGSFEYMPCKATHTGNCIQQMAPVIPILWGNANAGSTPYGIAGDPSWQNYTVSSDVYLPTSTASAGVIGRYSNQNASTRANFDGYDLSLAGSGKWMLNNDVSASGKTVLQSGTVPLSGTTLANTWHTLSLSLQGSTITATIDGTVVATVTSTAHTTGMAGLESTWDTVQYDNFGVK